MNAWLAGLVFIVCLAAGCTFDNGAWFAQLHPQLAASYQLAADRNVDGRFQRLASGYEVALDRAELAVGALDLVAAASGGAGAFDPAHPPPGYSLCHNGHCHADGGRLVPYAAIEAELAGGGDAGGAAPALSLAGAGFNLLAPQAIALTCPEGCRLGRTHIVRVEAYVTSVHLEGAVRSGPGAPQMLAERRFTVHLPAAAGRRPQQHPTRHPVAAMNPIGSEATIPGRKDLP